MFNNLKYKNFYEFLLLTIIGGTIYFSLEVIFRGYSHISMFILGGLCFFIIGQLNEIYTFDMSLLLQMGISAMFITLAEFITGLIVNVLLNLNVWDYSDLPFNLLGQICLPFSIIWFILSLVGIILDDFLRYTLFSEEKPHYTIFGGKKHE